MKKHNAAQLHMQHSCTCRNEVDMHEKLVIIAKQKTAGMKVMVIVSFLLTCFCLILSMFNPIAFLAPTVVLAILWFFLSFRSNVEFEYTYYDGEIRFAKISNKSRRRNLAKILMDDVLGIAPKGDKSVYKYENDAGVPCKKLISGISDAKVYTLVCKSERGIVRYEFEPDEEMLDEITVKYPRSVIK